MKEKACDGEGAGIRMMPAWLAGTLGPQAIPREPSSRQMNNDTLLVPASARKVATPASLRLG